MLKGPQISEVGGSSEYVRISLAAAITLGSYPGRFFRDAKLYTLNLLLTYNDGCLGKCAYCGLSKSRYINGSWNEKSFIRVDWPIVPLEEVIGRMDDRRCSHVERVCISMVTYRRAREEYFNYCESFP